MTRARSLLVSGFGPFGDVTFNPSGAIATALRDQPPHGWDVHAAVLPVTFAGAPRALAEALAALEHAPSLLLGLGVHPGASFRLERCARAGFSAPVRPDTAGDTSYADAARGAVDRACSLDLRALASLLLDAGAGAVTLSNDAGAYVCERVFHQLLELGAAYDVATLFLHVPPERFVTHTQQALIVRRFIAQLSPLLPL